MTDRWELLGRLRNSPAIFDLLQHESGSELAIQKRLRREFPDELVRAAIELHQLRRRARAKFSRADRMWFDRRRLEQATPEPVARHKARRFHGERQSHVWDLCCGIGGDALALAERSEVIGVDVDPAVCLESKWNLEVYNVGQRAQFVCADVRTLNLARAQSELAHADADRRAGPAGRSRRLEDSVPGLDFLREVTRSFAGGAIKTGPASNFAGKFAGVEIELISLEGEAKEATLWFGSLAEPGLWRATVLPEGASLAGDPMEAVAEVGPLRRYLYDPDPAVVRAGLVDLAAEKLGLRRLDEEEEYLTSDALVQTPFAAPFEVLDLLPNNEREIRAWFRRQSIGQVEIKCRRIPIQADALRKRLPLQGDRPAVLIFARIGGKARAVVCRRVRSLSA